MCLSPEKTFDKWNDFGGNFPNFSYVCFFIKMAKFTQKVYKTYLWLYLNKKVIKKISFKEIFYLNLPCNQLRHLCKF